MKPVLARLPLFRLCLLLSLWCHVLVNAVPREEPFGSPNSGNEGGSDNKMAAGRGDPFLSLTSVPPQLALGRQGSFKKATLFQDSSKDHEEEMSEPGKEEEEEEEEQELSTTTPRTIWKFLSGANSMKVEAKKGATRAPTSTRGSMIATNRRGLLPIEEDHWDQYKKDHQSANSGALRTNEILNNLIESRIGGTFVPAGMHTHAQPPPGLYNSNSCQGIIGFSLVRAKKSSLQGQRGRVAFENTFTDLNQAWDAKRSVFQCRQPGLYFFSFNGRGKPDLGDKFWIASLMLNGVEVVSIGGTDESGSSNTILLPLNFNDEVWLQLMQGALIESDDRSRTGLTSFSGYRVGGIAPTDIDPDLSVEPEKEPIKDEESLLSHRHNLAFFDRESEERDRYNTVTQDPFDFLDSRERDRFKYRERIQSNIASPQFSNRISHPQYSKWESSSHERNEFRNRLQSKPELPSHYPNRKSDLGSNLSTPLPVRRYYYPEKSSPRSSPKPRPSIAAGNDEAFRRRFGTGAKDRFPFVSLLETSRYQETKRRLEQQRRESPIDNRRDPWPEKDAYHRREYS
ncbi:hypothetical protein TCAL_04753 [Tigriopus californicus]|uniref:C1q domain-containing protein n=2 Tax=Tigriopus californicus TaxID=6832 RepID=A0A553P1Y9_TIGCA|nr:hypothetical protein TCAL_04753 [Tigriopus californicus]